MRGRGNPLMMIDEIDEIGRGHNGHPGPLVLMGLFFPISPFHSPPHLPTLRCSLKLPIDFSQVLFVCTANALDSIRSSPRQSGGSRS
ncbi:hypothetical protein BKA70DRAFT_876196 [Coprinopsis sp. MPI-PUGE-AT-0042]|nr:hypothetical protein BKA70DRAFT_876196 [Coprinopsis sp. MPI-PUGE-AT-0042]